MSMLFIINPKSGGRSNARVKREINKLFPDADAVFTEAAGHATMLAGAAAAEGIEKVIAVGGDGTLNEVAQGLVGTETAMGVIPRGSGNGFAREIGASLVFKRAIADIKKKKAVAIDTGLANGELFINVAGAGIEADIANSFAHFGKRGKFPYFLLGAKKVLTYSPKTLNVTFDGKEEVLNPLTLVFANGRQYGSNFKVAPKAIMTDGYLDMIEIKDKNILAMALSLPTFFISSVSAFSPTSTHKVKEAVVKTDGPLVYHVDGEPRVSKNGVLKINIQPSSLKVLM